MELSPFHDCNTQLDAQPNPSHDTTLCKLFELVRQLVQDIEVELPPTDDALKDVRADLKGVDILAAGLVTAVHHWKQYPNNDFSETLQKNFRELVELLLQYVQYLVLKIHTPNDCLLLALEPKISYHPHTEWLGAHQLQRIWNLKKLKC